VIGLCLDGTGYGEDGAIWGGEILLGDYQDYQRLFHLAYVPLPGGDLAVRQPWRTALAHLERADIPWETDLSPVSYAQDMNALDVVRAQIERGVNAPRTSSMGRLFDAVAALVGIRQTANYEAQAAIELEFQVEPGETGLYPFDIQEHVIDPGPLLTAIVGDLRDGISTPVIATRFHNTVAEMMRRICVQIRTEYEIEEIALSGGVWQNMTLLDKTVELLTRDGFTLYLHSFIPANDGGISLGQAVIALHKLNL
jgi:hydrogenase maturation protein HypF